MTLIYILLATFVISLISLVGVIGLFFNDRILRKSIPTLVALSVGALIGGAFLHLLPEAIEEGGNVLNIFLFVIFGFSVFFVLEQFISWHHHHECEGCNKVASFSYLVLISDGIHNFIDGFVIAGAFMVSVPVGIVTSIVIALHEIPQEIGDFGVLIHGGMKKGKALMYNFLSALVAVIGGIIGFFLATKVGDAIIYLLPFAAGNFIYIASSDLIPEIKHKDNIKESLAHFLVFLVGIFLMLLLKFI